MGRSNFLLILEILLLKIYNIEKLIMGELSRKFEDMKMRVCIFPLIMSTIIYSTTCVCEDSNYLNLNNIGGISFEKEFVKYYEPCEPDIRFNFFDYTLPIDVNNIVNFYEVNKKINVSSASDLIRQNGFVVMEVNFGFPVVDFICIYEEFKDSFNPPIFVTTDTGLYLYYAVFDQALMNIEENLFVQDITDLTKVLLDYAIENFEQLDEDLKEATKRNIAYLSVAQKLIDPNAIIPELVADIVSSELDKIEAHRGMEESDIFKYTDDYSQYIPRGHYTRNETLKRYFKTMMWYGRMAFLLKGGQDGLISEHDAKIQTMQALLLATSLKNTHVGEKIGLEVWDRIYSVTAFFVGFADDLTPKEYIYVLEKVLGSDFELSELYDENKLFSIKKELALLPSPQIYGGTGNIVVSGPITDDSLNEALDKTKGMRLMGRRFVPDSYVFQHLTFPEVGGYTGDSQNRPFTIDSFGNRSYIRGLDLMAILGSNEALKILKEDGDTDFVNYNKRFVELKYEFDSLSQTEWNRNLYWSWLYSLKALLHEMPDEYPQFMQTQSWHKSRLNSALASWAQLRHDTILYAKQGAPPPPAMFRIPPGYVEPNPVFWARLLSLTRMTIKGLEDFNMQMSDNYSSISLLEDPVRRLKFLEELLQKLLEISIKQLANEPLSSEDSEDFFRKLPSILLSIVMDYESDECYRTTLVADVHTVLADGKVVEEGVGYVDVIVVACPLADGKAFLAAGPVFSYYEFKHPMNDRLTDEAWLKMLESPEKPQRPTWYVPLMRKNDNSSSISQ
jgi:hypothetical protein